MNSEQFFLQYKISPETRKVFDVLLDILKQFIKTCNDNNLTYYAYGGTLLGAVRHKGFIPWDDDIDILMPRKDYDRFRKIAPQLFNEPYHFQSPYTDFGYTGPQVKIRNSNTACIGDISLLRHNNYNQGIFISIFPLDGVTGLKEASKRHEKLHVYKRLLYLHFTSLIKRGIRNPKTYIKKFIVELYFIFVKPETLFRKMDRLCSKYAIDETDYVCSIASHNYTPQKTMWNKEWYNETVYLDFEDIKIAAPSGYHEVLTKQFGDYMKPPKSVSEIHSHSLILDTEKSYKYYMEHPEIVKEIIKILK